MKDRMAVVGKCRGRDCGEGGELGLGGRLKGALVGAAPSMPGVWVLGWLRRLRSLPGVASGLPGPIYNSSLSLVFWGPFLGLWGCLLLCGDC